MEFLKNADIITQGLFIAVAGLVGVFMVLILFFVSIKLLQKTDKRQE